MNNKIKIPQRYIATAFEKMYSVGDDRDDIKVNHIDYDITINNFFPQNDLNPIKQLLKNLIYDIQKVDGVIDKSVYSKFQHYFIRSFHQEPLCNITPLDFLINTYRILDVRKVHDLFKETIPNYFELVFEEAEIQKVNIPNNIGLLNCIAEIVSSKSELFQKELPSFLLKSSIEHSLIDFNQNKDLMNLIANTTGNSNKQIQIVESLNNHMSNQFAFLKWRDSNSHIKAILDENKEPEAINTRTNIIVEHKLNIKHEKIAYDTGISLNEAKNMCNIISDFISSRDYDNSITTESKKYTKEITFKSYTSRVEFDESGNLSAKKDKIYDLFKEAERLYKILGVYGNSEKLKSYTKSYNSYKLTNTEKQNIAKSFVDTLLILNKKALITDIFNKQDTKTDKSIDTKNFSDSFKI